MSVVNRQLNKLFTAVAKPISSYTFQPWTSGNPGLKTFFNTWVWPCYFTYVKAPADRYMYATEMKRLREYGLLYDDMLNDRVPVVELALELLPEDLKAARFRRTTRAAQLNLLKIHLPIEEQNFDPFTPYMAPYIEEAKFILQEENELMAYHPWDRRFCSGDVTGFGEHGQGEALMTTYQF